MSNFFANPALAWFALLGAVPIIIHLWNRHRYKTLDWAAMKFLAKAVEKTRKRIRLEQLLLLFLRVLLIVLLALALAQPKLSNTPLSLVSQEDTHYILVLDTTYSMQQTKKGTSSEEPIFARVKEQASSFIENNFHPEQGDQISILTSRKRAEQVIGDPSSDKQRALDLLANLSPSNYSGDLPGTIDIVKKTFQKSPDNSTKKILWFSDLQKTDWSPSSESARNHLHDQLSNLSDEVRSVALIDAGNDMHQNLGITRIETENKYVVQDRPVHFTVGITNYASIRKQVQMNLIVDNQKKDTIQFHIDPTSTVQKEFRNIRFSRTGPHKVKAVLNTPDGLETDNEKYFSIQVKEAINVLGVQKKSDRENDQGGQPLFPMKQALAPVDYKSPYRVKLIPHYLFRDADLQAHDLLVLANLPTVVEKAEELKSYVKQGGSLLMFLGDQVLIDSYNEQLYDQDNPFLPAKLKSKKSSKLDEAPPLADISFSHPAMQFFQSHKGLVRSLLTHTWIHVNPPSDDDTSIRTLAKYKDRESIAISERLYGQGKVMLVTTTANKQWNYWMGFQGYVVLMDQLAQYLIRHKLYARNKSIGSTYQYEVPLAQRDDEFRVETPSGSLSNRSPRPVQSSSYALMLNTLQERGFYRIERRTESNWNLQSYIAANIDPEEGNLQRISVQKLRKLYPEFSFEQINAGGATGEQNQLQKQESNLWKLLAYAALCFLVLEGLFALIIDRRRTV